VFLGIIAFATLLMAIVQVGLVAYGWILARRVSQLVSRFEREMKPLAENLNAVARDAARATGLAAAQVERVDRLLGDVTSKIEETVSAVQKTVVMPLRDGAALLAGLRAALDVFRELTSRSRSSRTRAEEEDALFIG
jgi:hypothetical protein